MSCWSVSCQQCKEAAPTFPELLGALLTMFLCLVLPQHLNAPSGYQAFFCVRLSRNAAQTSPYLENLVWTINFWLDYTRHRNSLKSCLKKLHSWQNFLCQLFIIINQWNNKRWRGRKTRYNEMSMSPYIWGGFSPRPLFSITTSAVF